MGFKEAGPANERLVRTAVQISYVFWATVPVFMITTNVYRRTPVTWAYAIPGYLAGVATLVIVVIIARHARRREWSAVKPWMALTMTTTLTIIVIETNLSAGGDPTVYRAMFMMPLILVAIIGDRTMMGIIFVENVLGFAYVTYYTQGEQLDTLVVSLFTWGAVFVAVMAAVHIMMMRFARSMRSAESVSLLAAAAADVEEWPPDPETCVQWIAGALVSDRAVVYARQPGEVWSELAHWPESGIVLGPPSDTEAIDASLTREGLVIPVEAATGQELVILAGRSEVDPAELEGTAQTVGRLVGGMAERFSLVTKLRTEARMDPLTGIANRRGLLERFEIEFDVRHRAGGDAAPLAVAILDIDHFKRYNDTFGHLEGDDVLRLLGTSIAIAARPRDLPARYGGEEFCLLLSDGGIAEAAIVLGRVRGDLERAAPDGTDVSFSCGVAVWDGAESADALLTRADEALYVAKENGRDQLRAVVDRDAEPVLVPLVRHQPVPARP